MKGILRRLIRIPRGAASGGILPPAKPAGPRYILSEGMVVPSGHDPYGPHFADDDCVLSARTGICIRDHAGPHEGRQP